MGDAPDLVALRAAHLALGGAGPAGPAAPPPPPRPPAPPASDFDREQRAAGDARRGRERAVRRAVHGWFLAECVRVPPTGAVADVAVTIAPCYSHGVGPSAATVSIPHAPGDAASWRPRAAALMLTSPF